MALIISDKGLKPLFIFTEYAKIHVVYGDIQSQTVFDQPNGQYLLVNVGWDDGRIHDGLVHVDIIDDKYWIQCDGTEYGIAKELEDAGIPKILLAFRSPELHTGYAVA